MTESTISHTETTADMAPSSKLDNRILSRKLLISIRDLTRRQLKTAMQGMFDNADDALFKMAEHSGTEKDQSFYFDSMRIVRIRRKEIAKNFILHIDNCFEEFLKDCTTNNSSSALNNIDYENLSLVEEADLEVTLAGETLVNKIKSIYSKELGAIVKRINHLNGSDGVEVNDIPCAPQVLCDAFMSAISALDAELKINLILLKLFDQHVTIALLPLYNEINREFINAGVLPKIKYEIKHSAGDSATTYQPREGNINAADILQSYSSQGFQAQVSPESLLGSLQQLLGSYRANQTGQPGQSGGQPTGTGPLLQPGMMPAAATGQQQVSYVDTPIIVQALGHLADDAYDRMTDIGADQVSMMIKQQLINTVQTAANTDAPVHINPVDNDIIDLVAMLFEFILEDDHLPVYAKASIALLQIPIIRAAIADHAFFSTNQHPARTLLNELAKAALGLDETTDMNDNPVLNKINQVVETINRDFIDNVEIFTHQLEEFRKFTRAQREVEKDSENTLLAEIKQREETSLAKAWVKASLNEHLQGKRLPQTVLDVITGPWKEVMLQTYLQNGDESPNWKNQLRFIDVLCWSVEPKKLNIDRRKLGNIIQHLTTTLRTGLTRIDYPTAEIDNIFNTLEPYHLASARGEGMPQWRDEDNDAAPSFSLFNTGGSDAIDTEHTSEIDNVIMQMEKDFVEYSQPVPSGEYSQPQIDEHIVVEDIVLSDWNAREHEEQVDDEYLELARHLELGKWIEFADDNGKKRRARLAWKSELLGEFTFTNWKFDVIADKSLNGLAADLRRGTATLVDDVPIFERAMSTVMTSLGASKS